MKELSELDQIKAFISATGFTEISRRTKIGRRTLHYLVSGRYQPNYGTLQKLLREMAKQPA